MLNGGGHLNNFMIRIFDIENDKVVLTPNCLLIPEFKKIVETFEEHLKILAYIDFLTNPESPYADTPEGERSEIISRDLQLKVSLDNHNIVCAIEKAETLFTTPTRRFYLDSKVGLEKMGTYLKDTTITGGRDGNDSTFLAMLKGVGKIMSEFKHLEKHYAEEVSELRGGQEGSYDERK